jgi:hypothetical protein
MPISRDAYCVWLALGGVIGPIAFAIVQNRGLSPIFVDGFGHRCGPERPQQVFDKVVVKATVTIPSSVHVYVSHIAEGAILDRYILDT